VRFICARGEKTPEMAVARAHTLRESHPGEDGATTGSMVVDGHEAIVGCGCGRAACQWSVVTLQPRECTIFPMHAGDGPGDEMLPPHDGQFPLLSIINSVHFHRK
jgi:hypothetical protein